MIRRNKFILLPAVYKIAVLLIMLLPVFTCKAQGLQFNSNDSLMTQRTSYVVFANDVPTFKNHLLLSFDLSLWDNDHLGYVFNITDARKNSYSLTYIYNYNGSPTLNFNIDSKSNKIEIPLSLAQLKKGRWTKIKAEFDLKNDAVAFLVNGRWYKARNFGFEGSIMPNITFGKNPHYSDVPKMAVKNLQISDENQSYVIPLNEWKGKIVHTADGEALGNVDHPVWLINESYFWAPRFNKRFNEVAGLNFDANRQDIFIYKTDSLVIYNVERANTTTKAYNNKLPVKLLLGKSVVNNKQNKCYVYEVQPQDTVNSIAALDLNTLTWQKVGKGSTKEQRHHHNVFFDKDQTTIYLFGGYGSFSYYKNFFKYAPVTGTWENVNFTGDTITPRFFSGSSQADENNDVYIFGGYGNQSGNQIVGGTHFYDLYKVNLTNHTIKKCWEINPNEEPFVSANNLIVSEDKKYFYALCYPHEKPKTNLRLYKFSLKNGSYQIVSGNIPVASERIESDFNLFYDHKQDAFFCTAQEFTSPTQSTVKIYSLKGTPVTQQAYLNAQHSAPHKLNVTYIYFLLFIIIATCALWYFIKKKKRAITEVDINDATYTEAFTTKTGHDKKPNTVYLFGEFTVYDKNSRDITYLFSPKIKQLFILILLNSKNEQGVVSKKISTTLWPDKDLVKTKNIKGVTINHLRSIIADIDGIELTFSNDTYCFKLNDRFFCDYFMVMDAIADVHQHHLTPLDFINNNYNLIARGGLMQHLPDTWLDDVKVRLEEQLVGVLLPELRKIYESGDHKRALEVSRVILNIDPFNDIALKYKLKSLRRLKGVDHARKVYEEFAADYHKSLGSDYPVHFEKICK